MKVLSLLYCLLVLVGMEGGFCLFWYSVSGSRYYFIFFVSYRLEYGDSIVRFFKKVRYFDLYLKFFDFYMLVISLKILIYCRV